MNHDLVIRGGTVIDGTGGGSRRADVAIDGTTITAVGEDVGTGTTELDATGLLVTPGWVDVHTHYDGQVTWDPYLTPSCWHGVTTVVMGNCGVGFAPVKPEKREWLIDLMEGVEDIPGTALHEGIQWAWESFPEYLDAVENAPHALDVCAQIPHGALRGYVMGDRGAEHVERPTADEIAEMGRLVAEAVEAGAVGFTTSRTVNHRSADGRHTPSLTASADELLGIAKAMGETGKGVFEVVCDFVDLESEFALLRSMVEVSGRPMSITTLQATPDDQYRKLLLLIADAADAGLPMKGQVAPRPVGLIMSLEGRVHPFAGSPTYQTLAELPLAERVERLREPDTRSAILAEGSSSSFPFDRLYPLTNPVEYDPGPEGSLAAIAARQGSDPTALALDIMLDRGGMGTLYTPVMNYADGNLDATKEMLTDPNTVPGLGDAGAHCTMICDGSFPTYLLTAWGRDRADRFPLEWVFKKQCADTARLVGLDDRGVLAAGYKADLNLIELAEVAISAPEMIYDLPADGKRLVQRASGYRTTIVSGEIVVEDGTPTGNLPGRLVRGEQPRP